MCVHVCGGEGGSAPTSYVLDEGRWPYYDNLARTRYFSLGLRLH